MKTKRKNIHVGNCNCIKQIINLNQIIFHLITKDKFSDKLRLDNVLKCLNELKANCFQK